MVRRRTSTPLAAVLGAVMAITGCGFKVSNLETRPSASLRKGVTIVLTPVVSNDTYETQAVVEAMKRDRIDHVVLRVYKLSGGNEVAVQGADGTSLMVDIPKSALDAPVRLEGLAMDTTYRVRATAFGRPGTDPADQISRDYSYIDIGVGRDDRLYFSPIPVRLANTPFQATGKSGLQVNPGSVIQAPGQASSGPSSASGVASIPNPAVKFPAQMQAIESAVAATTFTSADPVEKAAAVLDIIQAQAPELLGAYGVDASRMVEEMRAAAARGAQPLDISGVTDYQSLLQVLARRNTSGGQSVQNLYRVQSSWVPGRDIRYPDPNFPNRFGWDVKVFQDTPKNGCSAAVVAYAWGMQHRSTDQAAENLYHQIQERELWADDTSGWWYSEYGAGPQKLLSMVRSVGGDFGGPTLSSRNSFETLKALIDQKKTPIVMLSSGNEFLDGAHWAAAIGYNGDEILINDSLFKPVDRAARSPHF